MLASIALASACPKVPTNLQEDAGISVKEQKAKEEACDELETMLCAKASTCSLIDYNDCKDRFDPLAKCESNDLLAVDLCRTEMRNMHCDQDLPASCLSLQ